MKQDPKQPANPLIATVPQPAVRHRGPHQVLPDLPEEAFADLPKNLPHKYLTDEQLALRRLYDAQRQREWRRTQAGKKAKELRHRNSAAGGKKPGEVTMAVGTAVPVAAPPEAAVAAAQEDLLPVEQMMAEIRRVQGGR